MHYNKMAQCLNQTMHDRYVNNRRQLDHKYTCRTKDEHIHKYASAKQFKKYIYSMYIELMFKIPRNKN